jgi:hypothetical protein
MYGIERRGYGKHERYQIRNYYEFGSSPVTKLYRTEQAARKAADEMGIKIVACGDLYEIRAAIDKAADLR